MDPHVAAALRGYIELRRAKRGDLAVRTGHTTSKMINRYRRAARSATELGLGSLRPLDEAIPELRLPSDCPGARDTGPTTAWQVPRIKPKAEVAELADAADSKSAIP